MPYEPTWTDETWERGPTFAVYDQREGFAPAWAKVRADDAQDAVDIAEEISGGRLSDLSETLVVRVVR
jgi:hypothetical protein